MKRLALLIPIIFASFSILAQDTGIKEVGFTTANLNDFGLTYRFGSQESLWRINAVSSGITKGSRTDVGGSTEWSNLGVGFQLGKEWRKIVNEKFELRYGADLQASFGYSSNEALNVSSGQLIKYISKSGSTGANAVLGFNFIFSESFVFGAEFQPSLTYGWGKLEFHDPNATEPNVTSTDSFSFGFSSDAIRLSLLYRFSK